MARLRPHDEFIPAGCGELTAVITVPKAHDKNTRHAWDRMLKSASDLSGAALLAFEAAARAWSRWEALEERIAELGDLEGEIASGPNGVARVKALRTSANDDFRSFLDIAEQYGFARPSIEAPIPTEDMFVNPIRPGTGKRGRPRFQMTEPDRNRAMPFPALRWDLSRIALTNKCNLPVLRSGFEIELEERDKMRDRLDGRTIELAMLGAKASNKFELIKTSIND